MSPLCVHVPSHSGVIKQIVLSSCSIFFLAGMFPNQLNDATFAPRSRNFPRTRLNPGWTYTELPLLFQMNCGWTCLGNLCVALRMRQCWAIHYVLKAADLACVGKGALDHLAPPGMFLYHTPMMSIFQRWCRENRQVVVIYCFVEGINCLIVDYQTSLCLSYLFN